MSPGIDVCGSNDGPSLMRCLRVAFYCPNKPLGHPAPSGDLAIASALYQGLNRLGHDCREVVRFRSRWWWRSRSGRAGLIPALREAAAHTTRWRPDLWLTYHSYYKSPDVIGPLLASIRRVPYVLFQPMFATKYRKRAATRIGYYLNRIALGRAAYAFTNNRLDIRGLHRVLGEDRVEYLPPWIATDLFRPAPETAAAIRRTHRIAAADMLLLAVARFRADVKLHSLLYLFGALRRALPRAPSFRLLLVGDGPMESRLRREAQRMLPGRVVFVGSVCRRELFRYYSAADLFVFPGIGESLGMVYLEAQACGCPVVALDSPGVAQVVRSPLGGILVERDDGSAMADAVVRLLRDPGLRQRMAEGAMRFVQRERSAERSLDILGERLQRLALGHRLRP